MSTAPIFGLTVRGLPAPQGSKRHVGKGVMIESSKFVRPWRSDVKSAALDVLDDRWVQLDEPLLVTMVFTFVRPKSHWRQGRFSHLLRPSAPQRPMGPPDLSKLARSTEDALTGVVWKDDARVVEYRTLAKHYASEGIEHVLPQGPGAVIRIWRLDAVLA